MILDYTYDSRKKNFSISYIKEDGMKSLLNFNVSRFKSFYKTPTGRYKNWDGSNCDERWTERPSKFEYKTFMKELDKKYKSLLEGKYNPKLYTFDIETMVVDDEFPEPSEAKFPITTISIANPNCDVIILGTRLLDEVGQKYLSDEFSKYVKDTAFFHTLGLKIPTIKYVYFESEEAMLKYFLKNIVSKVPVLAGWNSLLFDWQYIQNRVRFYYPNISLASCSTSYTTHRKNYKDKKEQTITLTLPDHTLIVDMMDVIDQFDMVVMPIKDSLSLDYIASESIKANKIKYDGSLDDLYNNDYAKYVFYNAIDSFLVQLIDRKFKTLNIICTQSLVCQEKIESCFSKIAITEAMFWHYFYDSGIKCVWENKEDVERGRLIGAYVRIPTPGKHNLICCNDFASLYPSTIITCNLSIENFVGTFYDEEALKPFKADPTKYIVVGANVHKNKGTLAKPELGDFIAKYLLEDELDVYRKDPRYFVSVNGSVYKNEKDYSFRCIQSKLKSDRNVSKYLAKQLEAEVITDIEHMRKGYTMKSSKAYPENIVNAIAGLGYKVEMLADMMVWDGPTLDEFERKLKNEITYLTSAEQAYKLIGNSMYGGSSHVAFFWFNMALANDITGEARNIIHKMESHIPEYMENKWSSMVDFHKKHGIELKDCFKSKPVKDCLSICYGDTDSLYISWKGLIDSIKDSDKLSLEKKTQIIVDLNTGHLDAHNREYMDEYYKTRHAKSVQNFELETVALSGVWLDVKKKYAQILLWKDGKTYDMDDLPMKIKGLEIVKSSYSAIARTILKSITRYLLEDNGDEGYLLQRLNQVMQGEKVKFYNAPIEDICGNMRINGYTKYILDDANPNGLMVAPKCPPNVKAAGNYNRLRNIHNLPGDPIYSGKVKWYKYYPLGRVKAKDPETFAFIAGSYPKWADKYAPISRDAMFQYMVLDPFNRMLDAIGIGQLNLDGSIQLEMSLF